MDQFARVPFARHEVIPTARSFDFGRNRKDAIGQWVSPVVVEEEPPIQALLSQSVLDRGYLHQCNSMQWSMRESLVQRVAAQLEGTMATLGLVEYADAIPEV